MCSSVPRHMEMKKDSVLFEGQIVLQTSSCGGGGWVGEGVGGEGVT